MERPAILAAASSGELPRADDKPAPTGPALPHDGLSSDEDFVGYALRQMGLSADTGRAPPLPARRRFVDLLAWRAARCFWRVYRVLSGRQREFNILTLGCLDGMVSQWRQREAVLEARIEALERRVGELCGELEKRRLDRSTRAAA